MKLIISNEDLTPNLGEYYIKPENFNDLAYHPYIQSQIWDCVIVEVCDEINTGYISQLIKRGSKMVPRFRGGSNKITPKQVLLLCSMFPDKRIDLVNSHKEGNLSELLDEMREQYMWNTELL